MTLDAEIEQRRQRLKKRALARQVHEAEELLEIEEEQENVSVALSLRNLSQLEDNNSLKSFN